MIGCSYKRFEFFYMICEKYHFCTFKDHSVLNCCMCIDFIILNTEKSEGEFKQRMSPHKYLQYAHIGMQTPFWIMYHIIVIIISEG